MVSKCWQNSFVWPQSTRLKDRQTDRQNCDPHYRASIAASRSKNRNTRLHLFTQKLYVRNALNVVSPMSIFHSKNISAIIPPGQERGEDGKSRVMSVGEMDVLAIYRKSNTIMGNFNLNRTHSQSYYPLAAADIGDMT